MHETITGKLVAGNELVVDHVTAHLEFRKPQSTPLEPGKWRGSVKVSEEQAITFFQKGTCILVSARGKSGSLALTISRSAASRKRPTATR